MLLIGKDVNGDIVYCNYAGSPADFQLMHDTLKKDARFEEVDSITMVENDEVVNTIWLDTDFVNTDIDAIFEEDDEESTTYVSSEELSDVDREIEFEPMIGDDDCDLEEDI